MTPDQEALALVEHPAKYSENVAAVIKSVLRTQAPDDAVVLDPFGGVGGIHDIVTRRMKSIAIELEPEWAEVSRRRGTTICADWLKVNPTSHNLCPEWDAVDVVVTSPTYGNRMADKHDAKERCRACGGSGVLDGDETCDKCEGKGRREYKRNTYRHTLGRELSDNNSGGMQWSNKHDAPYKLFHLAAWVKVWDILKPGGLFVLNISNHIRAGEEQRVMEWHRDQIVDIGFTLIRTYAVETPRNRYGANREARTNNEWVLVFRKRSDDLKHHKNGTRL